MVEFRLDPAVAEPRQRQDLLPGGDVPDVDLEVVDGNGQPVLRGVPGDPAGGRGLGEDDRGAAEDEVVDLDRELGADGQPGSNGWSAAASGFRLSRKPWTSRPVDGSQTETDPPVLP